MCPPRELARSLGSCIQGDDQLASRVVDLLRLREEDSLPSCTPEIAIAEILWPLLHPRDGQERISKLSLKEFTPDVNAFLHTRGEWLTYSAAEIGKQLANLNLSRKRGNFGSFLLLDRNQPPNSPRCPDDRRRRTDSWVSGL